MPHIDNAVINGLLCYVSTARNSYSEQDLLSICQGFYQHEKIVEAKKILFNFSGGSITHRRGDSKVKSDMTDILMQFKNADENNIPLPSFVADSYDGMPPASGFEVLAGHLIHLMEEMAELKEQIGVLNEAQKNNRHTDVVDIKEDVHDIKGMLLKKSSLSFADVVVRKKSANDRNEIYPSLDERDKPSASHQDELSKDRKSQATEDFDVVRLRKILPSAPRRFSNNDDFGNHVPRLDAVPDVDDWKVVGAKHKRVTNARSKKNTIRGKKKIEGGLLRGVQSTMDVYVGRCCKSVTSDILIKYIKDEK